MTRSLLLVTTALAAMTGVAGAADLPVRSSAPAPVVYAPVFTWTGFYVGLNAGYGWRESQSVTFTNTFSGQVATASSGTQGGFVGGAQAGYNWQMGAVVVGAEADIQYADIGNWNVSPYLGGSDGNYFGTVRARLGFAFDRALIYVTGGFAYGDIGGGVWGNSDTKTGWTVGGGLEYAFTNNWTAKIEGLYVNLDRGNGGAGFIAGTPVYVTSSKSSDFGVVRAGLNYKF